MSKAPIINPTLSGTVILPGASFYTGYGGSVFDKPVSFTAGVAGLSESDVGLNYLDNTRDLDKPISTLTQAALESKASKNNPQFTGTTATFPENSILPQSVNTLVPALNGLSSTKANLTGAAFSGYITAPNITVNTGGSLTTTYLTVNILLMNH